MECTEERGAEDLRQLSQSFGPGPSKESLEAARQAFFELVQNTCSTAIFAEIIEKRKGQVAQMRGETRGNLAELLRSPEYKIVAQEPLSGLPADYHLIEEASQRLFNGVAEAWAHSEVYGNRKKAEAEWEQRGAGRLPAFSPAPLVMVENPDSRVELLKDIALDRRLFRTPGIAVPCRLSYAVKEQVLQIVKAKGWWEVLPLLFLSEQGRHAILYKENSDDYPQLLASGLMQEISKKEYWLIFDKFFQTENWNPIVDKREVINFLQEHKGKNNFDFSQIPENAKTPRELEEGIIKCVGEGRVSDFIRFTAIGKTRKEIFNNLYNALREFAKVKAADGKILSFAFPTDDIIIPMTEIVEKITGTKCFLFYSKHRISEGEPNTCKVIILNENMCKAFSEVDSNLVLEELIKTLRDKRLMKKNLINGNF